MKQRAYLRIRNYLSTHKRLALFLSHGGIHSIALVVLLIIIGVLGYLIIRMSFKNFVVIDTAIQFENLEDNLNYPLRHFVLEIKEDSLLDECIVNINARFHDSEHTTITEIINKPIEWTWTNEFPLGLLWYRHGDIRVDSILKDKISITKLKNGFRFYFSDYLTFNLVNLHTKGNLLAENAYNPYFCGIVRFSQNNVELDSLSRIVFDFTKSKSLNTAIVFDKIYPEPTKIGLNKFSYEGKEAVESILRNGEIYFEGKDAVKAYRTDRFYLIFTVLIGTLIAFCIDIIIKLIYKWRALK